MLLVCEKLTCEISLSRQRAGRYARHVPDAAVLDNHGLTRAIAIMESISARNAASASAPARSPRVRGVMAASIQRSSSAGVARMWSTRTPENRAGAHEKALRSTRKCRRRIRITSSPLISSPAAARPDPAADGRKGSAAPWRNRLRFDPIDDSGFVK